MKVSELEGAQLDYWVSKANNDFIDNLSASFGIARDCPIDLPLFEKVRGDKAHYSTNWSQGGPIIEREQIQIGPTYDGWYAECPIIRQSGVSAGYGDPFIEAKTALIAAMRCYVASKFGDTVPE